MDERREADEREMERLRAELAAGELERRAREDLEQRQETLIARLRKEAAMREADITALREHLAAAEHEIDDLRAIRDALTPPDLPQRPGLDLAVAFLPASVEQVGGDFYLVAAGPQDSTVLVVGDVVGNGLTAAKRAAFVRTAFAATAPFSDDPCRLLSWANTALTERAGVSDEPVTAACLTYLPEQRLLRWAYAGHPPAVWLDDGGELVSGRQGVPLGIFAETGSEEGSQRLEHGAGVLLYTDGLTEARHDGEQFGRAGVGAVLAGLHRPSPGYAIAALRARVADFAYGALTDDLCLLALRLR